METAIIGGGPAGALAAARLAARGRPVTVFHDSARPEKPCGGGIPWRGLERLPMLLDPALPRQVVSRLILTAPSGFSTEMDLTEPVHVFARAELDGFMLAQARAAGARVRAAHVKRIEARAGGGFNLVTASGEVHPAGQVVGADGAGSVVRRTFLGPRRRTALSQALGWYVPRRTDDRMFIRFERGLAGYLWSFPRTDHLAVGICAPLARSSAAELKRRCRDFLDALPGGLGGPPDQRLAYAAVIPAPERHTGTSLRVEGEGWALLGDAAGAVDPLTREGIHYALETADLWADAVLEPAAGSYSSRFHARFPAEFLWAAEHSERFFAPAFTERLVRYCDSSAAVRRVLCDLISGRQPYSTLKRRLLRCAVPLMISLAGRRLLPRKAATLARSSSR